MKKLNFLFIIIILFVLIGCEGLKKTADKIFESSERAKYERRFSGPDSLITQWKNNYNLSFSDSLKIEDRFSMTVPYQENDLHAISYLTELKKGDQLNIVSEFKDSVNSKIFVDFNRAELSSESFTSQLLSNNKFQETAQENGLYRIIIQPEIGFSSTFKLKFYTQPSYYFPVAGKGNSAVQSFWGAIRDGGTRNHEGVDIFAARGTPVVAAVAGFVTRTGNQGLGGKQVWLRDGILGNSLYYAHLDSIITNSGDRVKIGDTLGLVGTTGNAEGGVPHLHFGIYTGNGAVDPWPYLRKREVPKSSFVNSFNFTQIKKGSNLRLGPGTEYEIIHVFNDLTPVKIIAANEDWYQISANNKKGFISKSRLQ